MISAFLTGALNPEEMRSFEQKIQASEELRRQVLTMQRFFDDMEPLAAPDVIEKIRDIVKDDSVTEHKTEGFRKSKYIIIALVSIVLLVLLYFLGRYLTATNLQEPTYVNNLNVVDEPFSSFIGSVYANYPPASNLLRSENQEDTATLGINSLQKKYRLAHIAMTDKDWVYADSLFKDLKLLDDKESVVSRDAVIFYHAITRLAMDSCSTYGRDLLNSIPEREVQDFSKIAKIVEARVRTLNCTDN